MEPRAAGRGWQQAMSCDGTVSLLQQLPCARPEAFVKCSGTHFCTQDPVKPPCNSGVGYFCAWDPPVRGCAAPKRILKRQHPLARAGPAHGRVPCPCTLTCPLSLHMAVSPVTAHGRVPCPSFPAAAPLQTGWARPSFARVR